MSLQKRFKKKVAPVQQMNAPISGSRLLNIKDAALFLSSHPWAIRQLILQRKIPYVRIGRGYLIDIHDLNRYVEQNKVGVAA